MVGSVAEDGDKGGSGSSCVVGGADGGGRLDRAGGGDGRVREETSVDDADRDGPVADVAEVELGDAVWVLEDLPVDDGASNRPGAFFRVPPASGLFGSKREARQQA